MEKFAAKMKLGGGSGGGVSFSRKVKGLFHVTTPAERLVESATEETLVGPDWARTLQVCDAVNWGRVRSRDAVRSIRKRLTLRNPNVQFLALALLESCVKNCGPALLADVASEKVLDDLVKFVDHPNTVPGVREKALKLIESWGEAGHDLQHLPVFELTYKGMKSRGIQFPGRDMESLAPIFTPPPVTNSNNNNYSGRIDLSGGGQEIFNPNPAYAWETFDYARNCIELLSTVLTSSPPQEVLKDDLTSTLVAQCRQSQSAVQRIVESASEGDPHFLEAFNVHDELRSMLSKYDAMLTTTSGQQSALIPPGFIDEEYSLLSGDENDGSNHALIRNRSVQADLSQRASSSRIAKQKNNDLIAL